MTTNWGVLEIEASQGKCTGCGIPSNEAKQHLRVPGRKTKRWYCSVYCVESTLFRRGFCHWCGVGLAGAHGNRKFCNDKCSHKSRLTPFGNGERLLEYLLRGALKHSPEIYRKIFSEAHASRVCQSCEVPLLDQRIDARYCSAKCKKRGQRKQSSLGMMATCQSGSMKRDIAVKESESYGSDF